MSQGPNQGDGPERGGQPQGGQPQGNYQQGGQQQGNYQQSGQPQGGQGYQQSGNAQQGYQQGGSGLNSNQSAALSYVLGWITGVIFYIIEDDDQYVRFHALQSILLSIVFIPVYFVLAIALGLSGLPSLIFLAQLAGLGLVIFLIYKAYNGEWYQLPVIGGIAMDKSPPSQPRVNQQGQYQQGQQQGNYQQGGQQQGNYQQGGQQQGNYQQGGQPQGGQQSNRQDDDY
jgi:uncharacterized membrane protein